MTDSARRCAPTTAFTVNEDGDRVLLDPWATAASALLDAAMALGAPDGIAPADALALTTWRTITRRR